MATEARVTAIIDAQDKASATVANVKKSFDGLSEGTGLAVAASQKFATALAAGSIGFGLFGAGLAKISGDTEQFNLLIAKAGANVDASKAQLAGFADAALSAVRGTAYSATEAAAALYQLAGGTTSAKDAQEALIPILEFASATGMPDLETATLAVGDAMTLFGLKGEETGRAVDILTQANKDTYGTIQELIDSFQQAAPAAATMGMSMEETTAILSALGNAGFRGFEAGVAIKNALSSLAAPSKDASTTLRQLGVATQDTNGEFVGLLDVLQQLEDKTQGMTGMQKQAVYVSIFGQIAGPKLESLLKQGTQAIVDEQTALENSTGATKEAAEAVNASLSPLDRMNKAFFELEQKLTPLANGILGAFADFVQFIADHTLAIYGFAGAIVGALVPAIVAATVALSGLTLALAPYLLIGGAVGLLVGGLFKLAGGFTTTAQAADSAAASVDALQTPMDAAGKTAGELGTKGPNAFGAIGLAAEQAAQKVQDANDKISETRKQIEELQNGLSDSFADSRQQEAEAIVAQQKKVSDLKKQIRDTDDAGKRRELKDQLEVEEAALRSSADLQNSLVKEISEAKRRAGLTDFQRKLEDIQNAEVEDVKQFVKQMDRLNQEIAKEQEKTVIVQTLQKDTTKTVTEEATAQTAIISTEGDKQIQKFNQVATAADRAAKAINGSTQKASKAFTSITSSLGLPSSYTLPSFDVGGTVPGPVGAPMVAVVHGGEYIIPNGTRDSAGGITVNITGNRISSDMDLRTISDQVSREIMRALRRTQRV